MDLVRNECQDDIICEKVLSRETLVKHEGKGKSRQGELLIWNVCPTPVKWEKEGEKTGKKKESQIMQHSSGNFSAKVMMIFQTRVAYNRSPQLEMAHI